MDTPVKSFRLGRIIAEASPLPDGGFAGEIINLRGDVVYLQSETEQEFPEVFAGAVRSLRRYHREQGDDFNTKILSEDDARRYRMEAAENMLTAAPEAGIDALEALTRSPDEDLAAWAAGRLQEVLSQKT